MTGINAGANMSGDLADPAASIPYGTLTACLTAVVVYVVAAVLMALTVKNTTLACDFDIMTHVAVWQPAVWFGLLVSMFSNILSSIIGSSRILQAIGKDDIIPCLNPFSKGSGAADEPRRAVLFSWGLVVAMAFIDSLNTLASITTFFFLVSYAITNLACFLLRASGAPNFRPTFKAFTATTAGFGAMLSTMLMFCIHIPFSLFAWLVFICIFTYILLTASPKDWGDVSQSILFTQVRKYMLQVRKEQSVKFWRPGILLFSKAETKGALILAKLCSELKKSGLYFIGHVEVGSVTAGSIAKQQVAEQQEKWTEVSQNHGLKAFVDVTMAPNRRVGYQNLMLTSGMGDLRPNTVVVAFPEQYGGPVTHLSDNTPNMISTPHNVSLGNSVASDSAMREYLHDSRFDSNGIKVDPPSGGGAAAGGGGGAAGGGAAGGGAAGGGGGGGAAGAAGSPSVGTGFFTSPEIGGGRRVSGGLSEPRRNSAHSASEWGDRDRDDVGSQARHDYVGLLADCAHFCDKNFMVARHMASFNEREFETYSASEGVKFPIDVWLLGESLDSSLSTCHLTLQYSWLLHRTQRWKGRSNLRVLSWARTPERKAELEERISAMLERCRLDRGRGAVAEVSVFLAPDEFCQSNDMIRRESYGAMMIFSTVGLPPQNPDHYDRYLKGLHELSKGLPPILMVHGVQDTLASNL